ncbi:alpha/beta fold hydrolase [Rhodocytophaga aerolata]|uniref:Alpha/beta fold hydrolase n=1 Tax=Rhodocytophaga aerolata TaxID=455078 RepID=A0ABT8RGY7_9BACT|nr:alpha/beta fold hydrolase [Rhodocytophaga aerolata]MDO1451371.1 alpha/beta fold hydrolase [Rhodocytophaga aerolata]
MEMYYKRKGSGKLLLLIHGIGSSHRSWNRIIDGLAAEREVIAIDLPGFGDSKPLPGEVSIGTLADAVTLFLEENNLIGIDAVGSSMGARLVLELVRRGGVLGSVISLDPGGFWRGWEVPFFYHSVRLSAQLVKGLQPVLHQLTGNTISRSLLFAQFSSRPWALPSQVALDELRTFVPTNTFRELLYNLAYGEKQRGLPVGAARQPLVIGWGKQDRVCLPGQANRALRLFPDAKLHWFATSGHFPQLDVPLETTRLILEVTGGIYQPQGKEAPVGVEQNKELSPLLFASIAVMIGLGLLFAFGSSRETQVSV